ncbi:MAG: DNA internalization-related competence protein ComEC/Rec2 [Anaerolineae bacterium]
MTLVYLCAAWLLGIAAAAYLPFPKPLLLLAGLIGAAIVGLGWTERRYRILGVGLVLATAGVWYHQFSLVVPGDDHLAVHNDGPPVRIRGDVVREPILRDLVVDLRIEARAKAVGEDWQEIRGGALLRLPRTAPYRYGDLLEIEGTVESPPELEGFSYRDYLARQGILSVIDHARVERLASDGGNPVYRAILALKGRAHETVLRILPEPQASVQAGILLGLERGIPRDLLEDFNRTNTTHIVAISGFNIAIVAGLLAAVGDRTLGRRRATYLSLVGIALYTVLVGAAPSVVRAAIMGSLYVMGRRLGRQTFALTSLALAAAAMTLLNPRVLWDLGFQLSFLATLGLILHVAPLSLWLEARMARWVQGEALALVSRAAGGALVVTAVAQVWVLPVIIHNFGILSVVSLAANALIVPVQGWVMILGGAATFVGMVVLPLGEIAGWTAWLPVTWTVTVVQNLAEWEWAAVETGGWGVGLAAVYYLALGMTVIGREITSYVPPPGPSWVDRPVWVGAAGLAVAGMLGWVAWTQAPDGNLHVYFLDVGQGDAILVRTPSGRTILVDGGRSPAVLTSALGERLPFWQRSLDLVVLTHPQEDHLSGLLGVMDRYQVETILHPGQGCPSRICEGFWDRVSARGIDTRSVRAGTVLRLGSVRAEVLHPPERLLVGTESDVNNNSLVLLLEMGGARFLLTGDVEFMGEQVLVASAGTLESWVLKVPHHGADTSTTHELVEAVAPRIAVISVGADNEFGHPAAETLRRLEDVRVLRTDERGTIELVTDGERLWIRTER